MSLQPPDFTGLFADSDHSVVPRSLGDHRPGLVRTVNSAELRLPTGRLVAAEPWAYFHRGPDPSAFVQRVDPGTYPVQLIVADHGEPLPDTERRKSKTVLAARLVITDRPVTCWQVATPCGPAVQQGHVVYSGMSSFGSPEVFDALKDTSRNLRIVTTSGTPTDVETIRVCEDGRTGPNLVVFYSGHGEGDEYCTTWVGYSADGAVVCFVTSFGPLIHKPRAAPR